MMHYSDFEEKLNPCRNRNILLGFSGGADSCALFLLLEHWRKIIPFKLTAVHFEHGLRGEESLRDAEFCRRTAEKYNVDFQLYHLNVPDNILKNETMESAARRMRLEKWRQLTDKLEDYEIHLAHHADDLKENVFLRLFRGANVSGLCGLREYSLLDNMPIRRIMLDFSRSDIEDFLINEKFGEYCIDKTNFDSSIGRNFLRNKIFPAIEKVFPYAGRGIVQSAAVCEIDADFIERCAGKEFEKIRLQNKIPNVFFAGLHEALRSRVLRMYLSMKLGYDFVPDKNFLLRFNASLAVQKNTFEHKIELDDENFFVRCSGSWNVIKKQTEKVEPVSWDWIKEKEICFGDFKYRAETVEEFSASDGCFYFDIEEISCPLEIGPRKEGETFEKFGGSHSTVKSELTNQKIHGSGRDKVGILRSGNGEIMLIGDFRRSSFAPIIGKKRKILQITVEKLKK